MESVIEHAVIERGLARCPRCVAVAEYHFVELTPNLLRYEVNCRRCGECYREEHGPVPPTFGALATTAEWSPEVPRVPLRQRAQMRVAAVRTRAAALTAALNRRTATVASIKLT